MIGGGRLGGLPLLDDVLAQRMGQPVEKPARLVGAADESRVLQVVVVPDQAPRVQIADPGRDLAFGSGTAVVEVSIEAGDEEGLDGLRLVYVRMSGSGESFAFEEGQLPLEVERVDARQWRGRARLSLSALKLDDGDSIVYRALVRDTNPLGEWVSSDAFTVDVTGRWTSPTTGADYPAGWTVTIPADELVIDLRPTVADQELDTRATTGVVYWEGSQVVDATRAGRPLGGEAYVELTGYASSLTTP